MVLPAAASCRISRDRKVSVLGSRPAVGSSNSSTSGLMASTEASATFFFSPPLRWYGGRSRRCPRPRIWMVSSVRCSTSPESSPRCSGPKAISSQTLGENSCASEFWKTKPTRRRNRCEKPSSRNAVSLSSSPKAEMRPALGKISPSSIFSSVDLPEPLAPSSASRSPGRTEKLTPDSASASW